MKILAVSLFAALYVIMIGFQKWRVIAVWLVALIYLATGILPLKEVGTAIDWNVLMMMAGTMVSVYYFIESKMPNRIADMLLDKAANVCWVTIYMSLFAGVISAFIDNVATVLMVAPVGMAICRKLKISPVPMILSIAVSSNLQGAATLVGDTTSIMLGAYADMDFMEFFWMNGRLGIFFAVELGALATIPIMLYLFRKDKDPVQSGRKTRVKDPVPSCLLAAMVVMLIIASFFKNKPPVTNGLICMAFALMCIVYDIVRTKRTKKAHLAIRSIDFNTLFLLAGMFVVIQGIEEAGVIDDIAGAIAKLGGGSTFILYTVIVWGSVLISAFVDNIPYVATMLPVITTISAALGIEPYLLYFGLLCGATLGGNLTPVGASANITAVGMLRQFGHEVSVKDFMRIGVPFTLAAVTAGYLFIWIVWH